jgi:hypothetical protein
MGQLLSSLIFSQFHLLVRPRGGWWRGRSVNAVMWSAKKLKVRIGSLDQNRWMSGILKPGPCYSSIISGLEIPRPDDKWSDATAKRRASNISSCVAEKRNRAACQKFLT